MFAHEAQERGIILIGDEKVKEIAASRIGADVSSITFNKISLKDGMKHKKAGEGEMHKDKKDKKDKNHKEKMGNEDDRQYMPREGMGRGEMNPQPSVQPMPQPQQIDINPTALPAQPHVADFIPVYKVKCQVGNVEYKFVINAVTGDDLHTSMDE